MGVPRGWLSSTRRSKPRTPSSAATLPTHTTAPRGTFHPPQDFWGLHPATCFTAHSGSARRAENFLIAFLGRDGSLPPPFVSPLKDVLSG